MKFAIGIPTCREGRDHPVGFSGPKEIISITQRAEKLGIDFVWANDFFSFPQQPSQFDPPPSWYEVLISLACCAAVTQRIGLGIGVLVLPFRDPVIVAKQLATLDAFSNGRVILGVGIGQLKEELEALKGKERKVHRGRMTDEHLEALNLLFTQKEATFKGRYYQFEKVGLYPKPVQKPFPIIVAGHTEDTIKRVVKFGTGLELAVPTPQRVSEEKAKVVALAAETGRDPKDITFMGYAQMSLAQTHEEAVQRYLNRQVGARFRNRDGDELEQWLTRNYIGTPDEVAEKIGELGEAGMTHCIAQHIAADTISELEEQVQMFAEEVIPQVK